MHDVNLLEKDDTDDVNARTVEVIVGNKKAEGFQIAKKSNTSSYDTPVFAKFGNQNITEYSVNVKTSELKKIDHDREKLRAFLKFAKGIEVKDSINMIFLRIELDVGMPDEDDTELIYRILETTGNDVLVSPFFMSPKNMEFDFESYEEFLKRFYLFTSKEKRPVACSIPCQISRKHIDSLMHLHDARSKMYVVDFNGNKPLNPDNGIILRSLMPRINSIEEEYSEGSFVYGYDVPVALKGSGSVFCESQLLSSIGITAIGPKRRKMKVNPNFLKMSQTLHPFDTTKIFNPETYRLSPINGSPNKESFEEFSIANFNRPIEVFNKDALRSLSNAYNYQVRVIDVPEIHQAIKEERTMEHISSKNSPEQTVKVIKKISKEVKK